MSSHFCLKFVEKVPWNTLNSHFDLIALNNLIKCVLIEISKKVNYKKQTNNRTIYLEAA